MTQPDPITLELDPSGYVQGLAQADSQTQQFGATLRTAAMAMGPLQSAMNAITPSRVAIGGAAVFSKTAADTQQQLARLNATTKITGQNFGAMQRGMDGLARQFPVGNAGARQVVQTMTQLGLSTTTSAKSLTDLSKTFIRLGGATGESPAALAQGFTQLNRAMNTGFDTRRMSNLADSLTTISAKSGASAGSILQFSRAIAPMAQATGIGETQVLGISAAFSKLGEDGYAGANAMTRMLTDFHKSLADGSPTMAAYAQIVGQTTSSFTALARQRPAEALTQLTEAIGSSANAPRQLEQLGLDGIRTQRAIQLLSQSGGLRQSIADSVSAYGNGNNAKAGDAAMSGLNASLTRLQTNAEQLADAFGRPLLGALTMVTGAMGALVTPVRAVVGSSIGQGALGAAAYGVLPLLMARRLGSVATTGAMALQAATSGPVAGALGGYMQAGGLGSGLIGRIPLVGGAARRYANLMQSPQQEEYLAQQATLRGMRPQMGRQEFQAAQRALNREYGDQVGTVGGPMMLGANTRLGELGAGLGRFTQSTFQGGGPGLIQSLRGAGIAGSGLYMRMISEQMRMPRVPFDQRNLNMRLTGDAAGRFLDQRSVLQNARDRGIIDQGEYRTQRNELYRASAADIGQSERFLPGRNSAGGFTMGNLLPGMGRITGQGLATGAVMGGRAALGLGSMLFGSSLGAAMAGGMAAYSVYSGVSKRRDALGEEAKTSTGFIDDLRMSMGKAVTAVDTFAGRLNEAAKTMQTSPQTAQQAAQFTDAEYSAARSSNAKPSRKYAGGVAATAAMLRLQAGATGISPDELNRIQADLANSGYSPAQIRQITAQAGDVSAPAGEGDQIKNIQATVASIPKLGGRNRGFLGYKSWLDFGGTGSGLPGSDPLSTGLEFNTQNSTMQQRQGDVAAGIRDRAKNASSMYGAQYGNQQEFKEMDAAIAAAVKTGDRNLITSLTSAFEGNLNLKQRGISGSDLSKYGFTGALARADTGFRTGMYADTQSAEKAAGGTIAPTLQANWARTQIGTVNPNNALMNWFAPEGGATTGIQKAIQNLVGAGGHPESPTQQIATMQAALGEAGRTGMTMTQLAAAATEAADALGNTSDATHAFLLALRQQAQAVAQVQGATGSTASQAGTAATGFASDARLQGNDDQTKQIRDAGVQSAQQQYQQVVSTIKQRLKQQQDYQFQSQTMAADYQRQAVWGTEDYQRQISRVEEDYGTQRVRANQQFQLQVGDSTADFHRQQMISQRDFAKSMRRASEDAAKAMYDPYQRIQVQATWDAGNMLGNLKEQNDAIARQVRNLATLRHQGGGSNLIKLMGLDDPKNAQQLSTLVDDVTRDPAVLRSLNNAANARQQLGGALYADKDNTPAQRSIADFKQQQADAEKTFSIGMGRVTRNFNISMDQMAADNAKGLRRAAEDRATSLSRAQAQYATAVERMREQIKMADSEIATKDLPTLTDAMNKAIHGQFVDFQGLTVDGMAGWLDLAKRYAGELSSVLTNSGIPMPGTSGAAPAGKRNNLGSGTGGHIPTKGQAVSMPGGFDAAASNRGDTRSLIYDLAGMSGVSGLTVTSVNTGTHAQHSMHYQNEAVDFTGTATAMNNLANYIYGLNRAGQIRVGELIHMDTLSGQKWGLKNGANFDYGAKLWNEHKGHVHLGLTAGDAQFIEGHFAGLQPSAASANQTKKNQRYAQGGIALTPHVGMVAEAGSPEAMIPLNARGIGVLTQALKQFVSPDDARTLSAAAGTTYVTYDHSHTTHDNRVVIEKVDLKAETPRELADALAAKARQDNLTAPPQRRK